MPASSAIANKPPANSETAPKTANNPTSQNNSASASSLNSHVKKAPTNAASGLPKLTTPNASSSSKIPSSSFSANPKSQLKSPSIQLNSSLKQPGESLYSKPPLASLSSLNSPQKQPAKVLPAPAISSVSTFQANNAQNIARVSPYSLKSQVGEALDASGDSSPAAGGAHAHAKRLQKDFKEGIQAVKQSIQFNVCDIIEDDAKSNEPRESQNEACTAEAKHEINGLNDDLVEEPEQTRELRHFTEKIDER